MKKILTDKIILFLSPAILITLWAISSQNSFFWDTVQLGSRHAGFFYDNNFSSIILPDEIDSGHIPAFGCYIALLWKLFGKTLFVSHLAILPFVIGIFWQTYVLVKKFIPKEYTSISTLLVLLTPTLLGQITLVSPDVPMAFLFLLGVNSVLHNKKIQLSIAITFLFLISMRGMMVSVCLFFLDVSVNGLLSKNATVLFKNLLKRSPIYIPAILIFVAFNGYHYAVKGWIGYHADSPWASAFERVDFSGFLKNVAVLVWRLFDYGKIGIFFVAFTLLLKYRKQNFTQKKTTTLLTFLGILTLFLTANMLWAKNLSAHRYLLPVFVILSLSVAHLLFLGHVKKSLRKGLIVLWLLSILSGNFWVYPPRISQGWDATIAHLPYYELRKNAIAYLDKNGIEINNVASFFPNLARFKYIDLTDDTRSFQRFEYLHEYVLYSNVYNISDEHLQRINQDYELVKEFTKHRVYIKIYTKKPKTTLFSTKKLNKPRGPQSL